MSGYHYLEKEVAKVIKKGSFIDPFFGSRYGYSPYQGCAHRCLYCDGRAEKYHYHEEFESQVVVRTNLPEKMREELPKLREKGFILAGSGVSDPYQPSEKNYGLMTAAAEQIANRDFPAMVATKSSLVARDIDLWEEVHQKSGFILFMTIATFSDDESRFWEPGASPISERIATLKAFKERGIPVGVLMMPLLPFIWDGNDQIDKLLTMLKKVPIDFLLPGSLTLRPGVQKEAFFDGLKTRCPATIQPYEEIFSENRPSGNSIWSYRDPFYKKLSRQIINAGIPHQMPHKLFKGKISLADEITLLLFHLEHLYGYREIETKPLQHGRKLFMNWIEPRRKEFNRRRSLPRDHMDQEIKWIAEQGRWGEIVKNKKLGEFITTTTLEERRFNYLSLKWN